MIRTVFVAFFSHVPYLYYSFLAFPTLSSKFICFIHFLMTSSYLLHYCITTLYLFTYSFIALPYFRPSTSFSSNPPYPFLPFPSIFFSPFPYISVLSIPSLSFLVLSLPFLSPLPLLTPFYFPFLCLCFCFFVFNHLGSEGGNRCLDLPSLFMEHRLLPLLSLPPYFTISHLHSFPPSLSPFLILYLLCS